MIKIDNITLTTSVWKNNVRVNFGSDGNYLRIGEKGCEFDDPEQLRQYGIIKGVDEV